METREIPRNRAKGIAIMLGALSFVALGAWMVAMNETHRGIPTPVIGVAGIVFFGAAFVYGVRTLRDRRPGFVVGPDGFEDRSSAVAVGFVPWTDVRELAVMRLSGQRFIAVRVANPATYVERGSAWQRVARKANIRLCGTPITISTNTLRISTDELVQLLSAGIRRPPSP